MKKIDNMDSRRIEEASKVAGMSKSKASFLYFFYLSMNENFKLSSFISFLKKVKNMDINQALELMHHEKEKN